MEVVSRAPHMLAEHERENDLAAAYRESAAQDQCVNAEFEHALNDGLTDRN